MGGDMYPVDLSHARIGVALSGGGNRAAAFAGAVTALLDAGLMPQVRVLTSTSGGSLVNAAVACGRLAAVARQTSETDEVRESMARITKMIEEDGISPYGIPVGIFLGAALVIVLIPLSLTIPGNALVIAACFGIVVFLILANVWAWLSAWIANQEIASAVRRLYAFPGDTLPEWALARSREEVYVEPTRYDESGKRPDPAHIPVIEISSYQDPTLASLTRLPGRHLFVITDLGAEDTVHADSDGLRWFRGGQRMTADVTLASVVVDSMRFPGYLKPRSTPGLADGTTARFADGGVLDNHALSYFLVAANRADLDIVLSVVAENAPRESAARHRITQLLAVLGLIHRRLSGLYAERILESDWDGRFVTIKLPSDLATHTTLRRLGRDRTRVLCEAGRRAAMAALCLAGVPGLPGAP